MPQGKEVFLGLNKTGFIVFIILLLVPFCLPLCWIPFVIDSMKAEKGEEAEPSPDEPARPPR